MALPSLAFDDMEGEIEESETETEDEAEVFEKAAALSQQSLEENGIVGNALYKFGQRFNGNESVTPFSHARPVGVTGKVAKKVGFGYFSSFLTCKECNSMVFVDGNRLALSLLMGEQMNEFLDPEVLPKCPGCGKTNAFTIGCHDFNEVVAATKEARKEMEKIRLRSVIKVQSVYRMWVERRRFKQLLAEKFAYEERIRIAATEMQKLYRGHLDRRAFAVEKELQVVKNAHAIILHNAITMIPPPPKKGEGIPVVRKVWWYRRQVELELLYSDYRMLVDRTGHIPPLYVVEANILEVGKRVRKLLGYKAALIQAMFRGTMCRQFVTEYRVERARLVALRLGAVLLLQRLWRGWFSRKRAFLLRALLKKKALLAKYKALRSASRVATAEFDAENRMRREYSQLRNEETMSRWTGKAAYLGAESRPLIAFSNSAYGTDTLDTLSQTWVKERKREIVTDKAGFDKWWRRSDELKRLTKRHPQMKTYFQDEVNLRNFQLLERHGGKSWEDSAETVVTAEEPSADSSSSKKRKSFSNTVLSVLARSGSASLCQSKEIRKVKYAAGKTPKSPPKLGKVASGFAPRKPKLHTPDFYLALLTDKNAPLKGLDKG